MCFTLCFSILRFSRAFYMRLEELEIRFVPMTAPVDAATLTRSFRSSYSATLRLLKEELLKVRATNVTIQAGYKKNQIRNDGMPYADAKPQHRAVVVQFSKRGETGILTFRGTRYKKFEDNLRAVALSLQALRAVDRYGVVDGEQYAGFKQLTAGPVTREEKVAHLAQHGGTPGERAAAAAALQRMSEL